MANSLDHLPVFKKVGEIIRIHRCNIGSYKNNKTFLVNLGYGSSWVLFEGHPSSTKHLTNNNDDDDLDMSSADLVSEPENNSDDEHIEKRRKKSETHVKNVKSEEAISNFFGFQNKQQISAVKVPPITASNGGNANAVSNESSVSSNMHNTD